MISANSNKGSYSGEVELQLRVGVQQFALSEMPPDCVTLRAAIDLPPVENAEVIMMVMIAKPDGKLICRREPLLI